MDILDKIIEKKGVVLKFYNLRNSLSNMAKISQRKKKKDSLTFCLKYLKTYVYENMNEAVFKFMSVTQNTNRSHLWLLHN